jgi:Rrf2 family protein
MLSHTAEYALRALAHLAQLARGRTILGRDLAEQTGIPSKYLSKVMLSLRNAGLVVATRGTGGGYTLLRPADAIHLIDVVQLFDGPVAWPQCLLRGQHECSDQDACSAHSSWGMMRRSYLDFLEQTTLWQIACKPAHDTQLTPPVRSSAR